VAPHAPHREFTPETAYANADVGDWAGSPAVFEADRSDKPPYVRRSNITFSEGKTTRRQQLRTLPSVDDMIDAIFRRLRLREEASNTLAILTSDNGFLHGEHGMRRKAVPYTKSIRVPFFVRWPGRVAPGVRDNRFVANVDIAPSVLAAARLQPELKYPLDGKALLSPIGLTTPKRSQLFLEYFYSPDFANIPAWRAVRTKTFQYIQTYNTSGAISFREYYDLTKDPWQNENLLADGDPANDPPTKALATAIAADATCKGRAAPSVSSAPTLGHSRPGTRRARARARPRTARLRRSALCPDYASQAGARVMGLPSASSSWVARRPPAPPG
jgi:arylsulfatase A-like enzyme